jgi:N-methylhydantoinase A
MRLVIDTGGTFTDLIVEDDDGRWSFYKSPTTPDDPVQCVFDVLDVGAQDLGLTPRALLEAATNFVYGTTRATNALVTRSTARTALLVTEGFPDILVFREGGRTEPFNFTRPFPEPYVPRRLTFQVPERIGAFGEIVKDLDEESVGRIIATLQLQRVEAVAVCLLWSSMNPIHEERVGAMLTEALPDVRHTLSHELNPILREYRRASSTAIDASLKPVMTQYLSRLEEALEGEGFRGRLLMVTSGGGVLDANAVAAAPIHSLASGPAMAPVAGRWFAEIEADVDTAIVADTGGTSYDVSVVRRGQIPRTEEKWIGADITGFPAIDVKSIGAGGGSIAWVDQGGLLHVGPESAGAVPGPACYARGGTRPTLTDACVALGYLDSQFFLGGSLTLDVAKADEVIESELADPLGLSIAEAAAAIVTVVTEHMVQAIGEITINRGIDPRDAVLIGGGGAAGLNSVTIARRLGCSRVIFPSVGAVLSAAGGLMSDLRRDFSAAYRTTSADFGFSEVSNILQQLTARSEAFIAGPGAGSTSSTVEYVAQARYPHQIWELDVPLRQPVFTIQKDVDALRDDFHALHKDIFAVNDAKSEIEIVGWRASAQCQLRQRDRAVVRTSAVGHEQARLAYFAGHGKVEASVHRLDQLEVGRTLYGPAIIEAPATTIVVDPGASAVRTAHGALIATP